MIIAVANQKGGVGLAVGGGAQSALTDPFKAALLLYRCGLLLSTAFCAKIRIFSLIAEINGGAVRFAI